MTDGRRRGGDADVDAPHIDGDVRETDAGTDAGEAADPPAHRVEFDAAPPRTDADPAPPPTDADGNDQPGVQLAGARAEAVERRFDWRGWILVGAIFVSFLVVPGVIVLYPHVGPGFGLTFWDTYLALPLIPAVVLALLAVWATTRP